MACHITYDHFSAAQQTHARQFILPRLYMHSVSRSGVWVSASAISANLMLTERYWCKAAAPTLDVFHDGEMGGCQSFCITERFAQCDDLYSHLKHSCILQQYLSVWCLLLHLINSKVKICCSWTTLWWLWCFDRAG